ncbi:MAG: triose-phosphate isomerase [Chitinophagales bacterium]|nr:triose-phosphate isomerase [Chitinophagales bacterium]
MKKDIFHFLALWFNDDECIQVKTSGSTGKPKTIQIQKEKMVISALMTGHFFKLKENNTALLCISAKHIGGMMMILRALVFKLNLISVEPSNKPLNKIETDIDFAAMVPYQVQSILNETPHKLKLIKNLIIGGGALQNQLENTLLLLNQDEIKNIIIAYEPIWAIGTGKTATAQQAQNMHQFIRKTILNKFGREISKHISIIYGGSVKPENSKELFSQPDIDGALVGGASLNSISFTDIIQAL